MKDPDTSNTAQKMKFSIKYFFSKCDHSLLLISYIKKELKRFGKK